MERDTGLMPEKLARQLGRAIACLLLAALLLGLTACGRGQAQQKEPQPEPPAVTDRQPEVQEPQKPQEPQEPEPEPETEPVLPEPEDEESDEDDGFPDAEEAEPHPAGLSFTQEEYDQMVADVLDAVIQDDMTPMEQARAVFDYVHNNIRYIGSSDKSDWMNGAYIGLSTGRGDCFTYYAVSRALLTALEIDNLEVQRIEGAKSRHYWNLVNCGDGWYHFDACPRSLKMPSFLSFMVTDEQVAAFTAMAGRNYYDFDDTLLPERATEIVTHTRPIPRPPEEPEEDPEGEEPGADSDEPMLPPEDDEDGAVDETMQPADGGESGTEANSGGESGTDANNGGESGTDASGGESGSDASGGETGTDASGGETGTDASGGESGADANAGEDQPDPAPGEGPPPEADGGQEEG